MKFLLNKFEIQPILEIVAINILNLYSHYLKKSKMHPPLVYRFAIWQTEECEVCYMINSALIRPAWTPVTIAMMVIGFMIFWPLGLAMIAYILYGDRLKTFKSGMNRSTTSYRNKCGHQKRSRFSRAPSGNTAFDKWREEEMDRLRGEREKLEEMRREFDAHVNELRNSKDQKEFERFMKDRESSRPDKGAPFKGDFSDT